MFTVCVLIASVKISSYCWPQSVHSSLNLDFPKTMCCMPICLSASKFWDIWEKLSMLYIITWLSNCWGAWSTCCIVCAALMLYSAYFSWAPSWCGDWTHCIITIIIAKISVQSTHSFIMEQSTTNTITYYYIPGAIWNRL